jgi:hypothetical protein
MSYLIQSVVFLSIKVESAPGSPGKMIDTF